MINIHTNTRAKEQLIIYILITTTTTIGMVSWVSQSFAATYIPPNSSSSTSGVLDAPASSAQCPPGHSAEYCSGYIAGFNEAIRSHQ
jgi:hypothetical protein